jgi:hypothetical protein
MVAREFWNERAKTAEREHRACDTVAELAHAKDIVEVFDMHNIWQQTKQ